MLEYTIHLITLTLVLALAVLGVQLQLGRLGLLNLGHIALFGLGGYSFALLSNAGLAFLPALLASMVISALTGAVLVAMTRSLKPLAFCLASFGFVEGLRSIVIYLKDITGGPSGLILHPLITTDPGSLFFTYLLITVIFFFGIALVLTRSTVGLRWHAQKENEDLARSLGMATHNQMLFVAVLTGASTGLSGAFLTAYLRFIDPSVFAITNYIQQLTIAIASGIGTVTDTIFGVFSLTGISEILRFVPINSAYLGPLRQIFYAFVLLIILALGAKLTFNKTK